MKRKLVITATVLIVLVLIIVFGAQYTGKAVFSNYETINEGLSRTIGYQGVLYTISDVKIIDGDNAIINITSDQTKESQEIFVTESMGYALNEKIGKAKIYVDRISMTGGTYGQFVRVRIESTSPPGIYGWKK